LTDVLKATNWTFQEVDDVTIIEHDPDWDNKTRRKKESFWIKKLKTLSPNGINVRG
jgi:hypothetical protein